MTAEFCVYVTSSVYVVYDSRRRPLNPRRRRRRRQWQQRLSRRPYPVFGSNAGPVEVLLGLSWLYEALFPFYGLWLAGVYTQTGLNGCRRRLFHQGFLSSTQGQPKHSLWLCG